MYISLKIETQQMNEANPVKLDSNKNLNAGDPKTSSMTEEQITHISMTYDPLLLQKFIQKKKITLKGKIMFVISIK